MLLTLIVFCIRHLYKEVVMKSLLSTILKKIKELTTENNDIFYICNGTDVLPEKLSPDEELILV